MLSFQLSDKRTGKKLQNYLNAEYIILIVHWC